MASSSSNKLHEPKSLRTLACEVKYPHGNYLIHQFVLTNREPSDSCSESDIRAGLRSFPGEWVNRGNEDGLTALHLAVLTRNRFMVEMLLSSLTTVDVDAKCSISIDVGILKSSLMYGRKGNGETALHLVADKGFMDYAFSDDEERYYQTFLGRAAVGEDSLEKGLGECADVVNNDAADCNRTAILEFLISKGADVNARDHRGMTPLHTAVMNRCLKTVEVFVESGAALDPVDEYGETALHLAAYHDHIDILKLLISKGADANAEADYSGRTPLHNAVHGCLEAVQIIVESGAALDPVDMYGETALAIAERRNRVDIAEYIKSRLADVSAADTISTQPPSKKQRRD